jgi:hypothetical protein
LPIYQVSFDTCLERVGLFCLYTRSLLTLTGIVLISLGDNEADDGGMRHLIEEEGGALDDNVLGRELLQAGGGAEDDWRKFLGLKV